MNHRFNAMLHRLPACPECDAAALMPCTSSSGAEREPHRCRQRMVDGDIFVVDAGAARRAHKLRAIRELVATVNRPMQPSAAAQLVDGLRRHWGLNNKKGE